MPLRRSRIVASLLFAAVLAVAGAGSAPPLQRRLAAAAFTADGSSTASDDGSDPATIVQATLPRTLAPGRVSPLPRRPVAPYNDPVGDYLDWLQRTTFSVDDATATLLELQAAPERGARWAEQVTGVVSVWTSAYHNAMAEQAPPPLAATHVAIIHAFSEYNRAASTVMQAATSGDEELLAAGIDQALAGGRGIRDAFNVESSSLTSETPGPPPSSTPHSGPGR